MLRAFYTLFLFVLSAPAVLAGSAATPENARDSLLNFLGSVPGGARLRCLAKDYAKIVDSEASGSNARLKNYGLVNFVQSQFEKQPLEARRATKAFYDEAESILDHQPPAVAENHVKDEESPTLGERAGDSQHAGLKPGWLWNLALKHAGGDPNLASAMISLCGHDDTAQEEVIVPMDAATAQNDLEERQRGLDDTAAILTVAAEKGGRSGSDDCDPFVEGRLSSTLYEGENFQGELRKIATCTDAKRLPGVIQNLQKFRAQLKPTTFLRVPLHCPSGIPGELGYRPGFFLPESLGSGVDISPALRKRVAEAQAPFSCAPSRSPTSKPDPLSCLPAKAYHVYGGEFVACEMIARGHNPAVVTELAAALGWYYRGFYLTSLARDCGDDFTDRNGDSPSPAKVSGWLDLLAEVRHLGRKTACSTAELVDATRDYSPSFCDQPTKDALFLLRKWTILGRPGKVLGPLVPSLGETNVRDSDRPAEWTDARFQLAKAKYMAIQADFEWTMEQHRAGAKFAAEHCRPDPAKITGNLCN